MLNKRALGNVNVIYRRRKEFIQANAESFADYVSSLNVPDILITGDFTSTALEEEFAMARAWVDTLRDRGLAVTVYAGNHDVYTFEAVRTRRFERHFRDYLPSADPMPWRMTLPGGTPLILVPTVCANLVSSKGRISNKDVSAVGAMLADTEGLAVVSGHYPVLDETYGYRTTPERRLRNAAALRRVLGESGKRVLYVAGHVHRFSYVKDRVYPELRHVTTGAFFRNDRERQRQGEFSEITVVDGGFRVHHHVFAGNWERTEIAPREDGTPGG